MTGNNKRSPQEAVSFSHVHLYADHVEDLSVYKQLEDRLNAFSAAATAATRDDDSLSRDEALAAKRQVWEATNGVHQNFVPHGRDVVKQLLSGLGFRVTACRYHDSNTRTVLITSRDPQGVQILVTAKADDDRGVVKDTIGYFDATKIDVFHEAHGHRPGIGVLAFVADDLPSIVKRYQEKHPKLVAEYYEKEQILEVYAYYLPHGADGERRPDTGTILRFWQKQGHNDVLPGLVPVDAEFAEDDTTQPAYCDHWVSNVHSRTEFLETLHDTLGFSPKVDFNAGVVAAGEAQIESTVTGNDAPTLDNRKIALKDQRQVYLPINNALSAVGHVHGFLSELGQGVQHLASRVDNLVDFVQRANDYRTMTGEGFTFLRIPRSYYGILASKQLVEVAGLSEGCAEAIISVLRTNNHLTKDGAVELQVERSRLESVLQQDLKGDNLVEYQKDSQAVLETILSSRYCNLYSLLRHHVSEETYLGIVRNQILVDIQGEDLLYQIFTANILQRQPGDEAPFLEFIQRVCSECRDEDTGCPQKVRPGCGGFGIRNFLTLFLSIEVSKAMQEVSDAMAAGDEARQDYAQRMVDVFTDQLNESNPILTLISDAMTEEGHCKEQIERAKDKKSVETWTAKMHEAAEQKRLGNEKLMACSARFNDLMKSMREQRAAARAN